MNRVAAMRIRRLHLYISCREIVHIRHSRRGSYGIVKVLYRSCILPAWRRRRSADRGAQQALRRQPRAVARLGTPLRAAASDPLGRRAASLPAGRRRARPADAAAPRRRTGRRRGGRTRLDPQSASTARGRAGPAALRDELADALDRFDEPRAQAILDRLLAAATVDTLLSDVILPYLRDLGERWQRGEASIAQEHFASAVIRGRLLGLARDWGLGVGPLAVLACLPGEHHDLGLIALRARAARPRLADRLSRPGHPDRHRRGRLPPAAAEPHRPHAVTANTSSTPSSQLRALAGRHPVALGGAAAASGAPVPDRVRLLTGDLIAEATLVTTLVQDAQ